MENFEKCTVAMLGGPCSQHVTGNTPRLNQPQSGIVTRTGLRYTRDYLMPGICSLIKPVAMQKYMSFRAKIHTVML